MFTQLLRKKIYKVLVILFIVFLFHGCNDSQNTKKTESKQSKSKEVAYILPNDGPYYDLKWAGIKETLESLGYKPVVYSAHGYENKTRQFELIEMQIAKGVAGIILHPVSSTAVMPFVEEAASKGIPLIAENLDIQGDSVAGRVMLANYEIGWELAMSLTRLMNGKGKVVGLIGPRGQAQAEEMWSAARDYFRKFPEIKVERTEFLQANPNAAQQMMESILADQQDIDGVYTWYVQNTVGVAQAFIRMGYEPGQVKLVGKDINPRGEALLRDGYIQELLVGEPIEMGRRSALLLHDIIAGKPGASLKQMRNFLVDVNNIDRIDRSGFELTKKK